MNWMITIPKTISWNEYQKELDNVADGKNIMNYKTRYFPKEMKVNDRCYIVWDGQVRGWMNIVGMKTFNKDWKCSTTGNVWNAGKYIQRSGKFNKINNGLELKGFRGIRKYNESGNPLESIYRGEIK